MQALQAEFPESPSSARGNKGAMNICISIYSTKEMHKNITYLRSWSEMISH